MSYASHSGLGTWDALAGATLSIAWHCPVCASPHCLVASAHSPTEADRSRNLTAAVKAVAGPWCPLGHHLNPGTLPPCPPPPPAPRPVPAVSLPALPLAGQRSLTGVGLSRQVRALVCLRPWSRLAEAGLGWAGAASRGISVSLGCLRHWGSQALPREAAGRCMHPSPETLGPSPVPSRSPPWQNVGGQAPSSEWESQRLEGGPGK